MRQINIILLFIICFDLNAQKIKVHENHLPSPLVKSGWNLIFQDEFDSLQLNKTVWNIAGFNNDGTLHCSDPNDYPFTMNPKNVWVEDGLCKIAITNEEYLDCPVSAGEIKSYTVDPADSIHSWTLDYGFYVEIRINNLPIEEGLGSAGWLFAGGQPEYNEIDIWETDGKHKYKYGSTYWWDERNYDCSNEVGRKLDHSKFKVKNLSDKFSVFGIHLWSKRMDLTKQWLVFGLEWDEDEITYYLNNIETKNIVFDEKFNENKPCAIDVNDRPLYAKNIRIGTGPNSLGDKESSEYASTSLPKTLNIDYVRVYIKNGNKAIKLEYMPDEMCANSSGNMSCTYLPGVKYNWQSDAFEFMPNSENIESLKWVTVKNGIETNKYYPVTIICIFPDGYTETLTKNIFIAENPEIPAGDIVPLQHQLNCYYLAGIKLKSPSEVILWSEDFGITWTEGKTEIRFSLPYSVYGNFEEGSNYFLTVKSKNSCGTSLQNSALFVTPEFNEACLMRVDNTTADNTSNSNSEDLQNESIQTISVVNFNTLINILNEIQEPLEVHIYSLSGQVVSTFPLQHIQYNKIESLSAGLYLIIFFDAKHAITNKLYLYK